MTKIRCYKLSRYGTVYWLRDLCCRKKNTKILFWTKIMANIQTYLSTQFKYSEWNFFCRFVLEFNLYISWSHFCLFCLRLFFLFFFVVLFIFLPMRLFFVNYLHLNRICFSIEAISYTHVCLFVQYKTCCVFFLNRYFIIIFAWLFMCACWCVCVFLCVGVGVSMYGYVWVSSFFLSIVSL